MDQDQHNHLRSLIDFEVRYLFYPFWCQVNYFFPQENVQWMRFVVQSYPCLPEK